MLCICQADLMTEAIAAAQLCHPNSLLGVCGKEQFLGFWEGDGYSCVTDPRPS